MDAVIAYVNGCEKVWRTEYNKYCSFNPSKYSWFYDWGTLKYVLRGISTYMPYIKNVFLVVSNIEQVPDYVDQSKVKVVLHKDFIPEEYLPTFQSGTIELFLHKIEELNEEFIYFNDDMIPMLPIAYNDLMYRGMPCISFVENNNNNKLSYYRNKSSFRAACIYVTQKETYSKNIMDDPIHYNGPGVNCIHSPCVFLKSKNEDIFNCLSDYISKISNSKERKSGSINQYVYSDVLYLENNYIGSRLTLTNIKTNEINEKNINDYVLSINTNYLCINDFGPICGLTYKESADFIKKSLDIKFPKECKYETDSY